MTTLFSLLIALGLAPLLLGIFLAARPFDWARVSVRAGSVLLCALAFNLTFFWQELWLVIPKALTPGLHPVLYHNDHDWTGHAPTVELLQGSGALATLAIGLVSSCGLAAGRHLSVTRRLFLFWMAFEGIYQSLTQLALGVLLPGNDVGRALAYLNVGASAHWALLAFSTLGMAIAGVWLARFLPNQGREIAPAALLAIVLIVPFRVPRDLVEVLLIPLFVNLAGAGWLVLGATMTTGRSAAATDGSPGFVWPALALLATLLLFQLVLRRGVVF
jgi:hypothetical protein